MFAEDVVTLVFYVGKSNLFESCRPPSFPYSPLHPHNHGRASLTADSQSQRLKPHGRSSLLRARSVSGRGAVFPPPAHCRDRICCVTVTGILCEGRMFTHRTSRPSGRAVVSLSVLQNPSEMSPRSAHSSSSEQSLLITGSCASDATPNSSPEQPLRRTRSHNLSAGSKTSSPFAEGGGAQRAGAEAATPIGWSSEDDITVSEDGSDFEETLRKMPKRNKMPFSKETVAAKRPRVATEKEIHQGYGGELFDAIRQGRSAMQVLVDDWLDSYKQDRQSGLLDLINFLMKACSCKGVVSREMLEQMQNADIIQKMTEDFNEESVDYPLSFSNPTWKKFRLNLGEFLETLMSYCQYSVIYDEFLMDSLISLLTGLSDSQVRAFRHTSTFAAMKLMTGLVKIARDLSINLENCNRQYDVERTKTPQKMAPERLESLLQKRKDLRENLEEVGNMMNGIFKGVFVHRYRDIVADIRAVCMEELGKWMRTHSQFFLNDSYLKYVGWTLHDKQGHVRLQCVRSLQSLYTMQDVAGRLELFTNRFKDRMVYMVLDKEQQVAVEAIKLLGLVSETMDNVLAEEDYETVYPLVFASSRAVSSEAGAFLYKRYLCNEATDSDAKDKSRRGSSVAFFKILVSFFIESDLHDQAAYLVDSLWESASAHLKDWECQTDLLLDGEGMDDRQENAFIEILVSAARQAVEGTSPIGRVPVKKVLSGKDRKAQAEDKLKLTRHMIATLPHLLAKFSADAEKMCLLLMVIGYLDLEVYYTERLEKHLDLLLIQVRDILQKHTKPEVLESCSRALYFLCDREQNTYKRADIILSRMVDQLTDYFSQQVSDVLQVSDLDEDEVYNIAATMKRISALYSAHDLRRWELFEPCSLIIGKGIDTGVPEQVFLPALSCCYYSLLWDLWHLYSSAQQQQIDLSALKKRLCKFCDLCQSCLSDHHAAVREQAFILLSDLLIVFGGHIASGEKSHLQPLTMHPELPLQAEMAGLLLDHVFNDVEDEDGEDEYHQLSLLHKRRNLLAGYCKLILYSALQLRSASDVFRHYVKFYRDYGDIIKELLQKSRIINKEGSTRTLLLSLTQAYTALCSEENMPPHRTAPSFLEIRELARRFSLLLGPDQIRIREDIVLLHKEGLRFSLKASPGSEWSSQNLTFMDVLSEFSHKLLKQDKGALLLYLDQLCQQCPLLQRADDEDDDALRAPLIAYKKSLHTDSDGALATPSRRHGVRTETAESEAQPPSKRRKTKSKGAVEDPSANVEDRSRRPPPLMTSTVLKEKRPPPQDQAVEREPESAGSESDFEPSQSIIVRRHFRTPSSSRGMQTRTGTPSTLSGSLHRLHLMEEEEEIVIDEEESSSGSPGGETRLLDLLDAALLDSEEDQTLF